MGPHHKLQYKRGIHPIVSIPISPFKTHTATPSERLCLIVAIIASRAIVRLDPRTLHKVLVRYTKVASRGREDSVTLGRAEHSHAVICHISPRCASHDACLERSLALFLYLRPMGNNISWHAGFRTDPFLAHAWIQAGDQPVSEAIETSQFVKTMFVD